MFEKLCNTVKINGVEHKAIKRSAFPFSLGDRARSWLRSLDAGTIVTWSQMSDAFLAKFFPPSKTSALRTQITNFRQRVRSHLVRFEIGTKN
jgi:Retrotransposon gag protein